MKKWKFTFWLMAFLFAISLLEVPFGGDQSFVNLIFQVVSALSLIPLYGYAYSIAIGSKNIAIIIFTINFFGTLYGLFALVLGTFQDYDLAILGANIIVLLFIFLFLYPQYAYAFKSNNMWESNA